MASKARKTSRWYVVDAFFVAKCAEECCSCALPLKRPVWWKFGDRAQIFQFTGDNGGLPTADAVVTFWSGLQAKFPNATIQVCISVFCVREVTSPRLPVRASLLRNDAFSRETQSLAIVHAAVFNVLISVAAGKLSGRLYARGAKQSGHGFAATY